MNELYPALFVLCIVPILGVIKNIIKRKTFNIFIFLRTFCVYFIIYLIEIFIDEYKIKLNILDAIQLTLLERYYMFIFKILYLLITKN